MATRRPFWKWRHWKSIGFCLWPPSTRIWSLKLKFQSKLDLHSGNHASLKLIFKAKIIKLESGNQKIQYGRQAAILKAPETMSSTDRRTDGRTNKVNPVYPPSNFVGQRYNKRKKNEGISPNKVCMGLVELDGNLNHCGLMMHMATWDCVNIGSGNGLLSDGTKPLPKPELPSY